MRKGSIWALGLVALGAASALLSCGGDDGAASGDGGGADGMADGGGTSDGNRPTSDATTDRVSMDGNALDVTTMDSATDVLDGSTSDVQDADATVDAGSDATPDAGQDAAQDAGDAGLLPPQGINIAPGANIFFYGVTSDDQAIYNDGTSLFAVSLAGTSPVTIVASFSTPSTVEIAGPEVLVWNGSTAANPVSPLLVWSAAHGTQTLSSASVASVFAVSADGSSVAFSDNTTTDTKDLAVAASDGSGKMTLVPGTQRASCAMAMKFASNGSLFAQYCLAPLPDGGVPGSSLSTVSVFAGSGWTKADLATNVQAITQFEFLFPWAVDPSGTYLWAPVNTASGDLVTVATRTVTTVGVSGTTAAEGLFDPSGTNLFFRTTNGSLWRSSVASPNPPTALVSGVAGSYGISPDGRYLAYYHLASRVGSDLYVASTQTASPPLQVAGVGNSIPGDLFTLDSQFVLYVAGQDPNTGIGTVAATPVIGGPAVTFTTTGYMLAALSGSLVVADDNAHQNAQNSTIADIRVYDASGGAATRTLAQLAYARFALSADHTQLAYVTTQNPPGLYVMPAM